MAMKLHSTKVMPPTSTTIVDAAGNTRYRGASLTSRNTPALTMVEEWSSALVGVGATMAPSSQRWNGICAALVRPATESSMRGTMSRSAWVPFPAAIRLVSDMGSPAACTRMSAARNARPPTMLRLICVNEFLIASGVRV